MRVGSRFATQEIVWNHKHRPLIDRMNDKMEALDDCVEGGGDADCDEAYAEARRAAAEYLKDKAAR